jgi:uncharacterized damage-inducible protein DinB
MRKPMRAAAVVLAAGLWGPLVGANAAPRNSAPPKAGPSLSQAVLSMWNEVGHKLIAMAEDFPEDKYDFRPVAAERTFAEQLLHASNAMNYFTSQARGQKPPAEEDPKRENYKTKADVVAFVKKCVQDGADAIKAKGDKGMAGPYIDPDSKQEMQFSDLAYAMTEHSGEHYGQLAVYYRVAGLVPPESRPKK